MHSIINFFKRLFGVCETKALKSELWSVEEDNQVRVKLSEMPELAEAGKGVFLKGKGLRRSILLVRTENDQYLAFTNRCTHWLHRRLDPVPGPDPGQPVLRCSSLGQSTFDYEGNRLSGPAKAEACLTRHEVALSEGDLLITLAVEVAEEAVEKAEAAEEVVAETEAAEEVVAEAETAEESPEPAETAEEAAGQEDTAKEA